MLANVTIQFLNGLAGASSLFLVAAGLSIIFGVSRIVNFAHGSLYMVGIYLAYSLINYFGRTSYIGFWGGVLLAAVIVGLIGVLIEILVLRRIYRAPELFQLLATFALVLVIKDAALYIWGAEDLMGPRAPGLRGAVEIFGKRFPQYDLLLIVIGPLVLGLLWLLMNRTRWGTLVRAATQDREMVGALGVNQSWLFTSVFFLGAFLAGLGGAIQAPREPAQLMLDITVISDAFVVVVVGGMGSIGGAFLAALIIAQAKALCIALGDVSLLGVTFSFTKFTLVVEFVIMAVVLVVRPLGLLGKPQGVQRGAAMVEPPLYPLTRPFWYAVLFCMIFLALLPMLGDGYLLVLLIDVAVFALFAVTLHFLMGPAGMVSFGHAAYFGLGCYGAALALLKLNLPMEVALFAGPLLGGLGALLFGWFCVRLSGVYLAMLTLAFAQIAWSVVYQWDTFTGGSNGLVGLWPSAWAKDRMVFYYLAVTLCAASILFLWRVVHAPFGYVLRAGRDSTLRADAIGIDVRRFQWFGFVLAGIFAGLSGALFAFSKGSISPETLAVSRSVDGLVMVLLGGVQTLTGPVAGAALFTWLQDTIARNTEYWRAILGLTILVIVLAFPMGIAGFLKLAGARLGLGRQVEVVR
ncbi:ABC transporter permease [Ferrovibrio sp.]|uniref:ABC transporter permease n=1 Tax=Ferrovibrio sp. TaxID=1917215 RepID=UPI001B620375|nr:ABC transporter permease [Ferrovibrio sp.]MBP7066260.1 ABC transporter permease [Ferrovibrio sp.]